MQPNEAVPASIGQRVSGIVDYPQTYFRQFAFDRKWALGLQVGWFSFHVYLISELTKRHLE